ncbi:hypothetical protein AX17_000528 [Amanita inopinata Kibby_2008]|nr:hypothetical protein AX17_000528 [Amanita inopinata Kibby_2008]
MSPPYIPVTPAQLPSWIEDDAALIVDIRPYAAYHAARLPRALSLSVPTTLLKRPLFSLDRLAAMLSDASARARFASWPTASRILVYDADSILLSDSSVIHALLRKFGTEGFTRDLAWIQGGFQAVLRDASHVIDTHSRDGHLDLDEREASDSPIHSVLRPNRLPKDAFTLSSTTLSNTSSYLNSAPPIPQKNKLPGPLIPHTSSTTNPPSLHNRPAFNPFFDAVRQNVELSHGITERIPLRLPRRVRHRIHDLPFRWLQNIARRAAPSTRRNDSSATHSDEDEDQDTDPAAVEEGARILAMQFYRVELAEQQRLMSIMEHHTRESGNDKASKSTSLFPFSITAGIEKGEKNRYHHIWPFEHTRVRLHQRRDSEDDYVNASYVQPLGTRRRYIATQAPLPATFLDFWTLCWEQNVRVIVMLTREVEGAMVKCGAYWAESAFGPLRLRLISVSGQLLPDTSNCYAGYFTPQASESCTPDSSQEFCKHGRHSTTVKRVFELTHTDYPHVEPRKVVHLQYLEWPDMTVPDDPRGVLQLVKDVDAAVVETEEMKDGISPGAVMESDGHSLDDMSFMELDEKTGIARHALGKNSPVLLHCSAGVGRTGGFIVVDAVLDAIRREMKKASHLNNDQMQDPASIARSLHAVQVDPPFTRYSSGIRDRANEGKTIMQVDSETNGADFSESEEEKSPILQVVDEVPCSSPILLPSSLRSRSNSSSSSNSLDMKSIQDQTTYPYSQAAASSISCQLPRFPLDDARSLPLSGQRSRTWPFPAKTDSALFIQPYHDHIFSSSNTKVSKSTDEQGEEYECPTLCSDEGEPLPKSISPQAEDEREKLLSARRFLPPPASNSELSLLPFNGDTASSTQLKEPRRLHQDRSPTELNSFEEPVWEVVQDMREQRMSLCQNLRQYVFVHAAVVEGALMIVDEERRRENSARIPCSDPRKLPVIRGKHQIVSSPQTSPRMKCDSKLEKSGHCRHNGLAIRSDLLTTSVFIGKRVASPTELPKENKRGEVLLTKRPSILRAGSSRR